MTAAALLAAYAAGRLDAVNLVRWYRVLDRVREPRRTQATPPATAGAAATTTDGGGPWRRW